MWGWAWWGALAVRFCSGASARGLLCPSWGDLVPHGVDVPPLQPSANFAHKPTFKRFPALLLFSIWLCICCESQGIHCTGFLFAGKTLRPWFLPKELDSLHGIFEHPPLQMKSVGSCMCFKFQSPFSFDLHLVSRANSGKCLVSSSLADVCDFYQKVSWYLVCFFS